MITGHPRGTYLLCFAEMLERFSYYAMSGLLVLFLAGSPESGGLGWPSVLAIEVYGLYVGLLWFAPLLGGWIGDRALGARRAVIVGGLLIATGQALMLTPAIVPNVVEALAGVPVSQALIHANVPLGYPVLTDATREALVRSLSMMRGMTRPGDVSALTFAYVAPAIAFIAGLLLLGMGNALLKPNITVMLGQMYAPADPKRDEAFTLFYIGINIGAVLSAVFAGTIAERFGWAFGFGLASLVVLAGTVTLVACQSVIPPAVGAKTLRNTVSADRQVLPRGPLIYVVILTLFAALFWGAFMQTGGLLNLFTYREVDRSILGFTVPAPWFGSLTPFFLILIGPIFQATLNWLGGRGSMPTTIPRFCIGFLVAGIAFIMLATAVASYPAGTLTSMAWLLLFYLLLSIGELSLSPAGNAMAARYVPAGLSGRLMAIWFLCYGLGSFLSAGFGGLSSRLSIPTILALLGILLIIAAGLLILFRQSIEGLVTALPRSSSTELANEEAV